MPSLEDRSKNHQIMRNFSTKNAVESIFGRPANDDTSTPSILSGQRFDSTAKNCHGLVPYALKTCSKSVEKHEKYVKNVKNPYVTTHGNDNTLY